MSPSAGTGAGGLHVELCVPNENHRAYSELVKASACNIVETASIDCQITLVADVCIFEM
jgi:hypothetical protein